MACLCCIIFYCTYLFFTCDGRVVGRIHSWSCGGRINFHKFRKHTIDLTIGLVRYVVVWWSRYRRIGNLVVWWSQIGPINDTTNYPRAVIDFGMLVMDKEVVDDNEEERERLIKANRLYEDGQQAKVGASRESMRMEAAQR